MSGTGQGSSTKRQPDLYWKNLQQLKTAAICIRLYRNKLNRYVRGVEIVRAVASCGAIAGWAVFKQHPLLWSSIIALAQVADALKGVFPFAKLHSDASDLTIAMETLYINAEGEWESIYMGSFSEKVISERRTKLRMLQLDAEKKHFPKGFDPGKKLIKLATEEAQTYFEMTYSEENTDGSVTNTAEADYPKLADTSGGEHIPQLPGQRADAQGNGQSGSTTPAASGAVEP